MGRRRLSNSQCFRFADFDDEHITGRNEHWGRDGPEGSFDDEGGEMDDFIEHDGETNDEQFRAHRRALTKTARAQGISVDAAEEFLEIFGQDAETQQKLDMWYGANEIDHGMDCAAEVLSPLTRTAHLPSKSVSTFFFPDSTILVPQLVHTVATPNIAPLQTLCQTYNSNNYPLHTQESGTMF